jgi:DNA-binding NarL/FixJ family response regulator
MLKFSKCSPNLRILIVDDHELTRLSLQTLLAYQKNLQVIGLAANGEEALAIVKSQPVDIIILDLEMPIMDGWITSNYIKSISPQTQIIAHSSLNQKFLESAKLTGNFDAISSKDISTSELVTLIRKLGEHIVNKSSHPSAVNP